MKFKIKRLGFLTGMPVCIISKESLEEIGIHVGNRVVITKDKLKVVSIVDGITKLLKKDEIIVSEAIIKKLKLKSGDSVDVRFAERPHSITLIKKKLNGEELNRNEIFEIINNIANNSLTEAEVAFFISAVYSEKMSLRETRYLIQAMVESGTKLKLKGKIVDKHCIGGVAGNRTTPIVVAICAAAGLILPKTSSRAITSAAGTADTIETIARVDFEIKDIKRIIKKANACLVWGGALGLAPVDDKIIKIERIVNIDSSAQLLSSILSKKISVGSKYILIDIPYGKSAKVTKSKALKLKNKFLKLGKFFDLKIDVILTDGSEPVGRGIGPALEIKDIINVLSRADSPKDLEEKSLLLAGRLLELSKKTKTGNGYKKALEILNSGLAFKKFIEIINLQEGNIKDIPKPNYSYDLICKKKMEIKHIDNKLVNKLARLAGSPEDKAAGVYLHKKKGEIAYVHDKILIIHAESEDKLIYAKKFLKKNFDNLIEKRSR